MGSMRRKTNSQPSANSKKARVWDDSDLIELLAWLEHCFRHGLDFMNTSIGYLKQSTGKDFSSRQIRDKLKREWQNYGHCDKFDDIFTKGASAFNDLADDEQSELVERVNCLDKQLRETGTPSHKRSAPDPSSSTHSGVSQLEIQKPYSRPPIPDVRHRSIYSVPSDELGEETRMRASTAPIRAENMVARPTRQARGGPRTRKASTRRRLATSSTESPIPLPQSNTRVDMAHVSMLEDQLAEKAMMIAAQEQALVSQESFILTLQTRLFRIQNENNLLVNCSRAAKDHRGNPDMQEQLRRQMSTLKQQVKEQTQLEIDLEAIQTSQLGLSFREVISRFKSIQGLIHDACASISLIEMPDLASKLGHDKTWDPTLDLWAQFGSGLTVPDLVQHCLDMQIPDVRFARLLAASALCRLVFEPIFPALLTVDSPLLDQYRRQILIKFGHRELYIVDALAHKALVADGFFKSSAFKEMKTRLQNILSRSLQWLLGPQHDASDGSEGGLQSDEDIPLSVADAFKQALKASLKLKVELMVPDSYFFMHFFKPGDSFDRDTMIYDGPLFSEPTAKRRRKALGSSEPTSREVVTLCVFPAIYSSPRGIRAQNLDERSSMQTCVVDYVNFLNDAGSEGSQSWTLRCKATVVVRKVGEI